MTTERPLHAAFPHSADHSFAFFKQVDRELEIEERELDRQQAEARGELPLDLILDERSDDNETEEEEEEEERRRRSPSKKPLPAGWSEVKKGKKKKFRPPPRGYACDRGSAANPVAPGPNEGVARVCDQLSAINKGDQWRERGYSKGELFSSLTRHFTADLELIRRRQPPPRFATAPTPSRRTRRRRICTESEPESPPKLWRSCRPVRVTCRLSFRVS